MNRYAKQIGLPGFSGIEQEKLLKAKLLVIGAGGLGSPALLYLAAMGIGTIGIVDGDVIDATNLNRQIIFGETDIGRLKSSTAARYFQNKYKDLRIHDYPFFITVENALRIISQYDLVLDCTDNFTTRYLVNDACAILEKPLVFGAIYQHEGQVMVFHPSSVPKLNYRHVYPEPPSPEEIPDCNTTGVLGVLPGLIGVFMATEAVKVISGFGDPLINKIMFYNILDNSRFITEISAHPRGEALLPAGESEFIKMNYSLTCYHDATIEWEDVIGELTAQNKNAIILDVRELFEEPKCSLSKIMRYPLTELVQNANINLEADSIYVFCKSGNRSKKAAQLLKSRYPEKNIFSVNGGIMSNKAPVNQKQNQDETN